MPGPVVIDTLIVNDAGSIMSDSVSGSIFRTQKDRNSDFINVQDFDGNFQSAINVLGPKGGVVHDTRMSGGIGGVAGWSCPYGTVVKLGSVNYGLTSSIYMDRGTMLEGNGSQMVGGTEIHPDGGVNIGNVVTTANTTAYMDGVQLRNIRIDGYSASNSGHGIYLTLLGEGAEIYSVWVLNCARSGIKLFGKQVPVRICGTSSFYNGEYGFDIDLDDDGSSAGTSLYFDTLSGDDNTLGLLKLSNGNDRSVVTINNLKSERHSSGPHDPVILLHNFSGTLNIVGMHIFSGDGLPNADAVIKITGTSNPKINIIGASHRLYTKWIQDDVLGKSVYTAGNFLHGLHYGYADGGYRFDNINGYQDIIVGGGAFSSPGIQMRNKADTYPRMRIMPGGIYIGDGTATPVNDLRSLAEPTSAYGLNVQGIFGTTSTLMVENSAFNAGMLRLGNYHFWVDGSGRLRIKNGLPTSDTDGTVVGTQS